MFKKLAGGTNCVSISYINAYVDKTTYGTGRIHLYLHHRPRMENMVCDTRALLTLTIVVNSH